MSELQRAGDDTPLLQVDDVITAQRLGAGEFVVTGARWCGGNPSHAGLQPDGWLLQVELIGDHGRPGRRDARYQCGTGCFADEFYLGDFQVVGQATIERRIRVVYTPADA